MKITRGIDMTDIKENERIKPLDNKGLWLDNDLCIFFGPTGVGKSVFAVQLAVEISKAKQKNVAYIDLELSENEFMQRYTSEYLGEYFYRIEPEPNESFNINIKKTIELIKELHTRNKFDYVILDNLTSILEDATNRDKAKRTINAFKSLVDEYHELALLLIGHTPKMDKSKPITYDNLSGSKILSDLVKSVFAINDSIISKKHVYIKQLKTRNEEKKYDDDNVLVLQRIKKDNVLQFVEEGTSPEYLHLFTERNINKKSKSPRDSIILKLHHEGKTLKGIADILLSEYGEKITAAGVSYIINKHTKNNNQSHTNGKK